MRIGSSTHLMTAARLRHGYSESHTIGALIFSPPQVRETAEAAALEPDSVEPADPIGAISTVPWSISFSLFPLKSAPAYC